MFCHQLEPQTVKDQPLTPVAQSGATPVSHVGPQMASDICQCGPSRPDPNGSFFTWSHCHTECLITTKMK